MQNSASFTRGTSASVVNSSLYPPSLGPPAAASPNPDPIDCEQKEDWLRRLQEKSCTAPTPTFRSEFSTIYAIASSSCATIGDGECSSIHPGRGLTLCSTKICSAGTF